MNRSTNLHPWNRSRWQALVGERERLPHALLLHGPAGVGKRRFALELARWMLCSAPTADGGCGQCPSCRWFEQGSHPDFRRLEPAERKASAQGAGVATDPATESLEDPARSGAAGKRAGQYIRVEDVREVGQSLSLVAHQHGWRVVVIEPAEGMNVHAANALLKTLEEPPPRVMLILVTHQVRRLPATVLSRCRKLAFSRPERAVALAWLREEGVDESLLDEAGGAPLLALEYADPERLARRERFLAALKTGGEAGFALAGEYKDRVGEAWDWLSRWVCDLILVRSGTGPRFFPGHTAELRALSGRVSSAGLWRLQQELVRDARWLRHPLNGQVLLESWLVRYAECMEGGDGG